MSSTAEQVAGTGPGASRAPVPKVAASALTVLLSFGAGYLRS